MPNDQAVDIYNKIFPGNLWPYDQEHCRNNNSPWKCLYHLVVFDLDIVVAVLEVATVFAVDAVELNELVGQVVEEIILTVEANAVSQ